MVNSITSTATPSQINTTTAVQQAEQSGKQLPENGLATVAQQPDEYVVANKTLQFTIGKSQYQHTQNMIDIYTQQASDDDTNALGSDLSISELYKRAYVIEYGELPSNFSDKISEFKDDRVSIMPINPNQLSESEITTSKQVQAYESNQPVTNSLFHTQA